MLIVLCKILKDASLYGIERWTAFERADKRDVRRPKGSNYLGALLLATLNGPSFMLPDPESVRKRRAILSSPVRRDLAQVRLFSCQIAP